MKNIEPRKEEFMRIPIQTSMGVLTAVIECYALSCYKNTYMGWFAEHPNIIVSADDAAGVIDELTTSAWYVDVCNKVDLQKPYLFKP